MADAGWLKHLPDVSILVNISQAYYWCSNLGTAHDVCHGNTLFVELFLHFPPPRAMSSLSPVDIGLLEAFLHHVVDAGRAEWGFFPTCAYKAEVVRASRVAYILIA